MDSTALDSIVAKIYSGASGRLPWGAALNELAQAADVWTMHLIGVDKRSGGIVFSEYGGDATPQTNLDYIRTYHRIDPRTPLALANKTDVWFHCHEHFDDAFVAKSPFYQDFLIPYGGRYMSGTKIVDDDDLVVALGVHRGSRKTPLDADTLQGSAASGCILSRRCLFTGICANCITSARPAGKSSMLSSTLSFW